MQVFIKLPHQINNVSTIKLDFSPTVTVHEAKKTILKTLKFSDDMEINLLADGEIMNDALPLFNYYAALQDEIVMQCAQSNLTHTPQSMAPSAVAQALPQQTTLPQQPKPAVLYGLKRSTTILADLANAGSYHGQQIIEATFNDASSIKMGSYNLTAQLEDEDDRKYLARLTQQINNMTQSIINNQLTAFALQDASGITKKDQFKRLTESFIHQIRWSMIKPKSEDITIADLGILFDPKKLTPVDDYLSLFPSKNNNKFYALGQKFKMADGQTILIVSYDFPLKLNLMETRNVEKQLPELLAQQMAKNERIIMAGTVSEMFSHPAFFASPNKATTMLKDKSGKFTIRKQDGNPAACNGFVIGPNTEEKVTVMEVGEVPGFAPPFESKDPKQLPVEVVDGPILFGNFKKNERKSTSLPGICWHREDQQFSENITKMSEQYKQQLERAQAAAEQEEAHRRQLAAAQRQQEKLYYLLKTINTELERLSAEILRFDKNSPKQQDCKDKKTAFSNLAKNLLGKIQNHTAIAASAAPVQQPVISIKDEIIVWYSAEVKRTLKTEFSFFLSEKQQGNTISSKCAENLLSQSENMQFTAGSVQLDQTRLMTEMRDVYDASIEQPPVSGFQPASAAGPYQAATDELAKITVVPSEAPPAYFPPMFQPPPYSATATQQTQFATASAPTPSEEEFADMKLAAEERARRMFNS